MPFLFSRPVFGGRGPEHGHRGFDDRLKLLRPDSVDVGPRAPQAVGLRRPAQALQRVGKIDCILSPTIFSNFLKELGGTL
jgi:hypothetical protein